MINAILKYVFDAFVFLLLLSNVAKGSFSENIYSFETGLVEKSGQHLIEPDYSINTWRLHAHHIVIHTATQECLHMVPIVPGHSRHMMILFQNPEVRRGYELQMDSIVSKELLHNLVEHGDQGRPTWWFIFKGEDVCEEGFIGAAGASFKEDTGLVDVFGFFLPEFWGKGYATTILSCVMDRVASFLEYGYEGFQAMVHPSSDAAITLLTSAGFKQCSNRFAGNEAMNVYLSFVLSREDYKRMCASVRY